MAAERRASVTWNGDLLSGSGTIDGSARGRSDRSTSAGTRSEVAAERRARAAVRQRTRPASRWRSRTGSCRNPPERLERRRSSPRAVTGITKSALTVKAAVRARPWAFTGGGEQGRTYPSRRRSPASRIARRAARLEVEHQPVVARVGVVVERSRPRAPSRRYSRCASSAQSDQISAGRPRRRARRRRRRGAPTARSAGIGRTRRSSDPPPKPCRRSGCRARDEERCVDRLDVAQVGDSPPRPR